MNKILRKIRKIFYLNQIRLGPRFGRLPNEIVVEMLWENRLSFHNLLSISGGKKVEYLWESDIVKVCPRIDISNEIIICMILMITNDYF